MTTGRKPLSDPSEAVRRAGRESFIGTLRDCKAYGGTTALLVPGRVNKQVFYADAYKRSQDEVRKLVPVAEELGILICIENVWNDMLITPMEMARYIDEINSPWVGSYYDVGNSVRFGWPEHWIAVLGKRIKKIDIKEYSRKLMNTEGPGAGFNLKIGDPGGDCDWPSVLRLSTRSAITDGRRRKSPAAEPTNSRTFPNGWIGSSRHGTWLRAKSRDFPASGRVSWPVLGSRQTVGLRPTQALVRTSDPNHSAGDQ